MNPPLSDRPRRLDEIDGPVVLVCASGNRSARAARGHAEVANLVGGATGWARRGLPIERGG